MTYSWAFRAPSGRDILRRAHRCPRRERMDALTAKPQIALHCSCHLAFTFPNPCKAPSGLAPPAGWPRSAYVHPFPLIAPSPNRFELCAYTCPNPVLSLWRSGFKLHYAHTGP